MVYRYKKDTICFKMVSFFDLLPLASVNKVSVFNDSEYFFINTHLKMTAAFLSIEKYNQMQAKNDAYLPYKSHSCSDVESYILVLSHHLQAKKLLYFNPKSYTNPPYLSAQINTKEKGYVPLRYIPFFVSNPCPATAIVFVSQNLFYGQLPEAGAFCFLRAGLGQGRGSSLMRFSWLTRVAPGS